jgi:hypothetical protein
MAPDVDLAEDGAHFSSSFREAKTQRAPRRARKILCNQTWQNHLEFHKNMAVFRSYLCQIVS